MRMYLSDFLALPRSRRPASRPTLPTSPARHRNHAPTPPHHRPHLPLINPDPRPRRLNQTRKPIRSLALTNALQPKRQRKLMHNFPCMLLHRRKRHRARAPQIVDESSDLRFEAVHVEHAVG